jgi:hypothetical protein
MLSRAFAFFLLTSACLVAFPPACPSVWAQDDEDEDDEDQDEDKEKEKLGKDGKPIRKIDTESPEAQALAEMLSVPANLGKKDKKVLVEYSFAEEAEMEDWALQGFDRQECRGDLDLAAGSQREALMLSTLEMKGEFELEYHLRIERMAPSSSLIFVFGGAKSGAMWGTGWCKRGSRGFKPVSGKAAKAAKAGVQAFIGARDSKVKFVFSSGKVTCFVNGTKRGETKKLRGKLDGKIGLFMKNVGVRVTRIFLRGDIDRSKL